MRPARRSSCHSESVLRVIAEKELAQQELDKAETKFLEDIVEVYHPTGGCGGSPPYYAGWYSGLFYEGGEDSTKWDALVADVHSNPPSLDDPGSVLHQGVGSVDLLVMAVDSGRDRVVYLGPVLSHYEFEVTGSPRRLNDDEWRAMLGQQFPPDIDPSRVEGVVPPSWTSGYLVPR